MNHVDADREMSVEKYLLGELQGEARDRFEEHLFECQQCANDLKAAVLFAEAARDELATEVPVRVPVAEKKAGWFDWLLQPVWMAPALAACLFLLGYLSIAISTRDLYGFLAVVVLASGQAGLDAERAGCRGE